MKYDIQARGELPRVQIIISTVIRTEFGREVKCMAYHRGKQLIRGR